MGRKYRITLRHSDLPFFVLLVGARRWCRQAPIRSAERPTARRARSSLLVCPNPALRSRQRGGPGDGMAYKDILVVADDTPECEERVAVALRLAARHDAHAIGLMVREQVYVPRYATSNLPSSFLAEQREVEERARARVREGFERQAVQAGVPHEWYTADGDPVKAVSLFSRHADLAVIGQDNPESAGFGTSTDLAEHVVLASGRPVLVVPYVGTYPRVGERVMIAWDASREAARAVSDALPLLQAAQQVVTLSANPGRGRPVRTARRHTRCGHCPAPRPPRGTGGSAAPQRQGRLHRRHAPQPDRGRGHRPPRHGRVRPRAGPGDLARRGHPAPDAAHDRAGLHLALIPAGRGARSLRGRPRDSDARMAHNRRLGRSGRGRPPARPRRGRLTTTNMKE